MLTTIKVKEKWGTSAVTNNKAKVLIKKDWAEQNVPIFKLAKGEIVEDSIYQTYMLLQFMKPLHLKKMFIINILLNKL